MDFSAAGKQMANLAKLTSNHSQNWENLARIFEDAFKQAYEEGKRSAVNDAIYQGSIADRHPNKK